MNIGIDVRPLSKSRTGIETYIEQILKKLNEQDKENKYFLYATNKVDSDIKLNKNFEMKDKQCNRMGSLWFYFMLPKILKRDNIDVYWGTHGFLPKKNKYTKDIKFILTVHDLVVKKMKSVVALKTSIILNIFLKKSIKNADEIIADSECTKKDIIELYGVPENKIKVIYLGTNIDSEYDLNQNEEKEIMEKFKIEKTPYIFFVSTIEPRKNIETLIKAFNYIKSKEKTDLKLIIAGGLGWKYKNILNVYDKSPYKEDIIMPGFISKEEKKYLYKNAKCFVYPSLYEGFGLPILEAMTNDCLVVTSNVSSIPEVGGDAAYYYNNVLNYEELGDKIIEVINLNEEEKRKRINKGMEQVNKFTWEKCTNKTLETLIGEK